MGLHADETGSSFLGGAAHFYDTYETLDGKFVSIAAIEPQFYELLIEKAGLDRKRFAPYVFRMEAGTELRARWAELKAELAAVFRSKTRDEWCDILEGSDACFAPVLSLSEAPHHPHNKARGAFVDVGKRLQAAPAPRFGRTQASPPRPGVAPGTHSREILESLGFSAQGITDLIDSGAISVVPSGDGRNPRQSCGRSRRS
jgi:alpha-methylacyl-CoA racemase